MDSLTTEMTITNLIAIDIVLFILVGMISIMGSVISDHAPRMSISAILTGLALMIFSAYFNLAASIIAFQEHDISMIIISLFFAVFITCSFIIYLVLIDD